MSDDDPAPNDTPVHGSGLRFVADRPRVVSTWANRTYSAFALLGDIKELSGLRAVFEKEMNRIVLRLDRALLAGGVDYPIPAGSSLYDRLMDPVSDQHPPQDIRDLGRMMKWTEPDHQPSSASTAGYTYLGQFIAHDLSKMQQPSTGAVTLNWRSATLDLDSLLPAGASDDHWESAATVLGKVDGDEATYDDLPRDRKGAPRIPDPRNDHNLAVAQVHVAIVKFHQTVIKRCAGDGDARGITIRHFQSVVLHDYLRRVCDPQVYRDVLDHGRAVVLPDGTDGVFELPIEFAAACFRFGHSMARATYPNWNAADPDAPDGAHVQTPFDQLIDNTHLGGRLALSANRLGADWVTRWPNLVDMHGAAAPNVASEIDTLFPARLTSLKPWMIKDLDDAGLPVAERRNLAARTLFRGLTLGLPSGEQLAGHVGDHLAGRPDFAVLTPQQVVAAAGHHMSAFLDSKSGTFGGRTPLWLYILCEAKAAHGGQRLGPLGSRIVMETIHAAIEATPGGIIGPDQSVRFSPDPRLGSTDGKTYTFPDLLTCVEQHWSAD